jgi:hypothetical protein
VSYDPSSVWVDETSVIERIPHHLVPGEEDSLDVRILSETFEDEQDNPGGCNTILSAPDPRSTSSVISRQPV